MRRFRFVEVGMAAAIAAAGVTAVGLVQQVGAASSGTASSYVPITPCRLVDTRVDSAVGTRATPLGAGEATTFVVWGTNGNCTIPTSATGIATNVTAVNPTAASYVTVYPADSNPRPTASNLNVVAGGAPTPNQVTVGLSAAGAISAYNNGGTLDLIVDIVGYYTPAGSSGTGGGAQGPPGPKGDQGIPGVKGDTGPSGIAQVGVFTPTQIVQGAIVTCATANGKICIGLKVNGLDLVDVIPTGANIICATVTGNTYGSEAYGPSVNSAKFLYNGSWQVQISTSQPTTNISCH